MDKTITAFFDTDEELEAARSAARRSGADADRINVCRATDPSSFSGKNTVTGAAFGAAAGTIIGLGAIALESMGVVTSAGPVAGLISGAVLGAIVGGFADYSQRDSAPEERWLFSVSMDESGAGTAVRELKRCGADKVSVY